MTDKNYTILDLSEEFKKDKQLIRRRLSKLGIKPVNKETREHINVPLEYDQRAFIELSNLFQVSNISENKKKHDTPVTRNDTRNDTHVTHDDIQNNTHKKEERSNKEILIEVLERELKHSKEKLEKAEQEKENLFRLLNQQQQLSLSDRNKIKILEIELEKFTESKEIEREYRTTEENKTNKSKWYNIFNRSK